MPALKRTALPTGFTALSDERVAAGEAGLARMGRTKDCTVVALTIVTGLPYAECHAALKAAGRIDGRGCYMDVQLKALRTLGFVARRWSSREVCELILSYPKKGIAGLTTHQPRRFPKAWAPHAAKSLLLYTRGHVSAMKDGVVQDWAINKAKQVYEVWEVTNQVMSFRKEPVPGKPYCFRIFRDGDGGKQWHPNEMMDRFHQQPKKETKR